MTIYIETSIEAPIQRVFDLARSVDLHVTSNNDTKERVVGGKSSGLVELGDEITWEAVHFGVKQRLSSKVTAFERNVFFEDEMQEGAFKAMHHRHAFEEMAGRTIMHDIFTFSAPLGMLGRIAEYIFLKHYMKRFLENKARALKRAAESEEWKRYV